MSFTAVVRQEITAGGVTVAREVSKTGGSLVQLEESVADSTTDGEITFTLDVTATKAFYIVSSQVVTIETNNGTTPDNTLTLAAATPYVWHDTDEDAFLLDTDVTSIFVTNASGSTANIVIVALSDPTP